MNKQPVQLNAVPIVSEYSEMIEYLQNDFCESVFEQTQKHYKRIGIHPPWISYFFEQNQQIVATGGFKGLPKNNRVEIAYATVPKYERQGFGSAVCHALVQIARTASPHLLVIARTLMEESSSTRILKKNGFSFFGPVYDLEDGKVWEWHWGSPE